MALKILYNAMSARVGGGLTYATAQVGGLRQALESGEITVLSSPHNHLDLKSIKGVRLRLVRHRSLTSRILWEQVVMPFCARDYDVVVCPGNVAALWCPRPQVLVLQNPNYVGKGRHLRQNRRLRMLVEILLSYASMRRVAAVAVISQSLLREVESEQLLRGMTARLLLSGAPTVHVPLNGDISRYPSRFILSVANDYPHKRLSDIASAFGRVSGEGELVFIGSLSASSRSTILACAQRRHGDVRFLGPISDPRRIAAYYSRAHLTVSASELEAFPLTPHEAAAHGCPLLLSDIPPHREVAADRAAYFTVGKVEEMSKRMDEALNQPRKHKPWTWPISWSDHGQALLKLISEVTGVRNAAQTAPLD